MKSATIQERLLEGKQQIFSTMMKNVIFLME